MMKKLLDKTWLITGISSGIGLELTKKLLEEGKTVIGILRDKNKLSKTFLEYQDRLILFETDIMDFEHTEDVINEILEEYEVDVFVSNAGISITCNSEEGSINQISSVINTNLTGAIVFIKTCIPYIKAHGGKIIQMSSVNGQVPSAGWSYYCASKFGISGFCESVARELDDYPNASIMLVEPGNVNTPLWDKVGRSDLAFRKDRADISVKKLVQRIVTVSQFDKLPLYLPLGSSASRRIVAELENRLELHKEWAKLAADVDEGPKSKKLKLPKSAAGRKIYIWPLGNECKRMITQYDWTNLDSSIAGFIDAGASGDTYCLGRAVKASDQLMELKEGSFFIIASKMYFEEISTILNAEGMVAGKDYCFWEDLIN